MFKRLTLLGAGLAAGLLSSSAVLAQDTPRGDAANGKKLFETIGCFQCHGYVGQGGAAGPKLVDPVTPFAAFVAQLRTPRQVMPPYTERVLSEQQAADIYAHLNTIPKSPDPSTIPLLRN